LLPNDDDKLTIEDIGASRDASDGLGNFRPSRSFNELTSLFQPAVDAMVVAAEPSVSPVAVMSDIAVLASPPPKPTKKRVASTAGSESPASKRRLSSAKAAKKPSPPKSTAVTPLAAKTDGRAPGTPDPLSFPEMVASMTVPLIVHSVPQATFAAHPSQAPALSKPSLAERQVSTAGSISSDSDFKSIAQAAVSNLIISVGTGKEVVDVCDIVTSIDTSTAHIKALTGNNWVSACTDNNSTTSSTGPPASNDAKGSNNNNNRTRRQNLTPDERARQNRDRNREHARNTRLRKKAYVEELKRTLTELVAQRDAADVERRQSTQREMEQREVRFRVIEELLKLRGRNETNVSRWVAILEEGFVFSLPVTEFRSMVDKPINSNYEQVLTGAAEAMADATYLAKFMQTLSKTDSSDMYTLQYDCDRKNFFMDGCTAVLEWTARVVSTSPVSDVKQLLVVGCHGLHACLCGC
jgi:hypothetical protein